MGIDDGNEAPALYKVLINREEQYSIWPADRQNPAGWEDSGKTGGREECLEYISELWTDMRPRSLRDAMEARLSASERESGG